MENTIPYSFSRNIQGMYKDLRNVVANSHITMVTQNNEHLNQLPDLELLESVEHKQYSRPVFAATMLLLASGLLYMALWAYIRWGHDAPDCTLSLSLGIAMCAGLCVWALYRLLWSDFYWKTDFEGLSTRNLLRFRFVRWSEIVKQPRVVNTQGDLSYLTIIAASIWQHMRRAGRDAFLPSAALSLWDTIPDALPNSVAWKNPRQVSLFGKLILAVLVIFIAVLISVNISFHDVSELIPYLFIICIYGTLAAIVGREYQLQPEHVRVMDDVIEARMISGTLTIKPSDVINAWWTIQGYLHLKTAKHHVLLPLHSVSDESSKLILAIIRLLRNVPNPIPVMIPETLRPSSVLLLDDAPERELPGRVEIGLSTSDKLALACFIGICVLAILLVIFDNKHWSYALVAIAVLLSSLIVWWISWTYVIKADPEGLTKSLFFWKKTVYWKDIRNMTIGNTAGTGVQNTSLRYVLWDAEAQPLVVISAGFGSKDDRDLLLKYIQMQLKKAEPPIDLEKPWKAQAWKFFD